MSLKSYKSYKSQDVVTAGKILELKNTSDGITIITDNGVVTTSRDYASKKPQINGYYVKNQFGDESYIDGENFVTSYKKLDDSDVVFEFLMIEETLSVDFDTTVTATIVAGWEMISEPIVTDIGGKAQYNQQFRRTSSNAPK